MARAGRPLTAAKGGKGGRKLSRAPAAAGGSQASDPSRFAADAAGIEPMGGIIDVEITVRRPDGTKKTFDGLDAQARADEWLRGFRGSRYAAGREIGGTGRKPQQTVVKLIAVGVEPRLIVA